MKNFKLSIIARAFLAASVASAASLGLITSPAHAASASADIEATAGILPMLRLECSALNLGVWRIPVRSGGQNTMINIPPTAAGVPQITFNQTNVSASTKSGHAAKPAQCTLIGSAALDGTGLVLSGLVGYMFAGSATAFSGLGAPATPLSLGGGFNLPASVNVSGGTAVFYIGGILDIPSTVTSNSYGGYVATPGQTLTVDDGV